SAPTPQLRARAQSLWEKAVRCQQIQAGYAAVAQNAASAAGPSAQTPTVQPATYTAGAMAAAPPAYGAARGPIEFNPAYQSLAPRNVLSRIRQLAQGTQQLASPSPGGVTPATALAAAPAASTPVDEDGYAGKGWLMPLVARSHLPRDSRAGVPPYALTDDDGNVLFLITPSPGLSLREHLRQEVGVVGVASPVAGLENPHLVAQRIVVLKRHQQPTEAGADAAESNDDAD
ncbi:MAG: hypothetical protein KDA41_16590, partial [Planctomycetales bacterium]|nr:hypothetical protein [Planctomycetales bacterium]